MINGGDPNRAPENTAVTETSTIGEPPLRPRRRLGTFSAVAAVVLILDAGTKIAAVAQSADRLPVELLGGVLTFRLVRNSGAAFGIGTDLTPVFTLISIAVAVAVGYLAFRIRTLSWTITLGLLLGGALGNLVDRLARPPGPFRGHVVDWIELPHWPVFNLADSAIVCGGVLAVILAARGLHLDGTRARAP